MEDCEDILDSLFDCGFYYDLYVGELLKLNLQPCERHEAGIGRCKTALGMNT